MRRGLEPYLLALVVALFWGSTYPVLKLAGDTALILLGRVLTSAVGSLLILKIYRLPFRVRICRGDCFIYSIASASLSSTVFVPLMYMAVESGSPNETAAIVYTYPVFIVIISALLRLSRISAHSILGVLLGLLGVVSLYGLSRPELLPPLLSLAASISFALSSVLYRAAGVDPAAFAVFQNIASLSIAPFLLPFVKPPQDLLAVIAAVIHQGLGAAVASYIAWFRLLRISTGLASSLVYLTPAAAFAFSAALRVESPSPPQLLGLFLIMAGIYVSRRS